MISNSYNNIEILIFKYNVFTTNVFNEICIRACIDIYCLGWTYDIVLIYIYIYIYIYIIYYDDHNTS